MLPKPKNHRHRIVHLGNIGVFSPGSRGREVPLQRSFDVARRHPNWKVIGIDHKEIGEREQEIPDTSGNGKIRLKDFHGDNLPENWQQITADFEEGLAQLEDSSITLVSSDIALGHYSGRKNPSEEIQKYTARVLNLAHDKLMKGGRLTVLVGNSSLEIMERALSNSSFRKKYKIIKASPAEIKRSYWARRMSDSQTIWRITAKK